MSSSSASAAPVELRLSKICCALACGSKLHRHVLEAVDAAPHDLPVVADAVAEVAVVLLEGRRSGTLGGTRQQIVDDRLVAGMRTDAGARRRAARSQHDRARLGCQPRIGGRHVVGDSSQDEHQGDDPLLTVDERYPAVHFPCRQDRSDEVAAPVGLRGNRTDVAQELLADFFPPAVLTLINRDGDTGISVTHDNVSNAPAETLLMRVSSSNRMRCQSAWHRISSAVTHQPARQ